MVNFSILHFVRFVTPSCSFAIPGAINFWIPSFFFYEIKYFKYFLYLGYPNFYAGPSHRITVPLINSYYSKNL